jgi:hypothetical protein
MENRDIIRCIICLEEEKKIIPTTKLFHVPCECHLHIHPKCFRQCDSNKCLTCKKIYQKDKMLEFNEQIHQHYNSTHNCIFDFFYCLSHFIGYLIIIFVFGMLVTLIIYGIGYLFSCLNQFFEKATCDKNYFDGTHLYIGLFIFGIIMACRAEKNDRAIGGTRPRRINMRRE